MSILKVFNFLKSKPEEKQNRYAKAVKRLERLGLKDPTSQIIALEEEIELYRSKCRRLEVYIKTHMKSEEHENGT